MIPSNERAPDAPATHDRQPDAAASSSAEVIRPDAVLLELQQRHRAAEAALEQATSENARARVAAFHAIERHIVETPASTLEGLRVKARIAVAVLGVPDDSYEHRIIWSLLSDLLLDG